MQGGWGKGEGSVGGRWEGAGRARGGRQDWGTGTVEWTREWSCGMVRCAVLVRCSPRGVGERRAWWRGGRWCSMSVGHAGMRAEGVGTMGWREERERDGALGDGMGWTRNVCVGGRGEGRSDGSPLLRRAGFAWGRETRREEGRQRGGRKGRRVVLCPADGDALCVVRACSREVRVDWV